MNPFATIVLDLGLAFTLLFSVQAAFGWGELCGIRPGRDKSGLGGFVGLYMFFVIRWAGSAIGLWVTARTGEVWWLLGAHTLLGVVSVRAFGRGVERVQHDKWASRWLGWVVGVAVPAPALALVLVRVNAPGHGDSLPAIAATAAVLAVLHGLCFRRRMKDMLR